MEISFGTLSIGCYCQFSAVKTNLARFVSLIIFKVILISLCEKLVSYEQNVKQNLKRSLIKCVVLFANQK